MRVLLSTYGSRGDATPPSAADLPRPASELVAARFDTVVAAAEGCNALAVGGTVPAGVWR
jgi:vancomycin aglycone glucosyltransferase